MVDTRAIAVIGYKNSGKTTVIEGVIKELSQRGYKVGTLKHTVEEVPLDTPGKDTWRHIRAGARSTALINDERTAIFLQEALKIDEAVNILGGVDFLILEGFKTINYIPRIIVPKNREDLMELSNGLEFAIVAPEPFDSKINIPIFGFVEAAQITDLVEEEAFPLLPGFDCGSCGYDYCSSLAKAVMNDEAEVTRCIRYAYSPVTVKLDERPLDLNNFVQNIFKNVLTGLVKTLKGGQQPNKIEITYEVDRDE